jgi:hypothetical protein
MRFMMIMIPGGYQNAGPEALAEMTPEAVAQMMKYNEELQKAGVLLALDGLHPPATGARVSFAGGKPKVTDGPFAEAKEVIGGYWIIVARSLREAAGVAAQNPCVPYGLQFEIRPLESARASAFRVTNETPAQ